MGNEKNQAYNQNVDGVKYNLEKYNNLTNNWKKSSESQILPKEKRKRKKKLKIKIFVVNGFFGYAQQHLHFYSLSEKGPYFKRKKNLFMEQLPQVRILQD